jgi:hypothetical protein
MFETYSSYLYCGSTNRVITMQDVQGIIGELCYSQSQMSESTNISNTLAERLKMDRLLAQIKSDVTRLAVERLELRESLLDTHPHDPYKLGFTDSTEGLHYSSLLQEYLLEFASENDEISNIVNQQSAAFREHDKHSDFASHCTSDGNASPQVFLRLHAGNFCSTSIHDYTVYVTIFIRKMSSIEVVLQQLNKMNLGLCQE